MPLRKREPEEADCHDCKNCSSYFWWVNDSNRLFIYQQTLALPSTMLGMICRVQHTLAFLERAHILVEETNNSDRAWNVPGQRSIQGALGIHRKDTLERPLRGGDTWILKAKEALLKAVAMWVWSSLQLLITSQCVRHCVMCFSFIFWFNLHNNSVRWGKWGSGKWGNVPTFSAWRVEVLEFKPRSVCKQSQSQRTYRLSEAQNVFYAWDCKK